MNWLKKESVSATSACLHRTYATPIPPNLNPAPGWANGQFAQTHASRHLRTAQHLTSWVFFVATSIQKTATTSSWWLNQPIWKILAKIASSSPSFGVKIKIMFELPPPRHVWEVFLLIVVLHRFGCCEELGKVFWRTRNQQIWGFVHAKTTRRYLKNYALPVSRSWEATFSSFQLLVFTAVDWSNAKTTWD